MGSVSGSDARREEILRSALGLAFEDIVWLIERLVLRVAGEFHVEPELFALMRRRVEALRQLRIAQPLLKLKPDERVPLTRYERIEDDHGLWKARRVGRAFGKRRGWRLANNELVGAPMSPSAIQRSLERGTMRGRHHEDQMEGIRIWLRRRPGSRMPVDYENFVGDYNDDVRRQRRRNAKPLVSGGTIRAAFPHIAWDVIVGWADAGHSTKAARKLAKRWYAEQPAPDGLLVAAGELALLTDRVRQNLKSVASDPRFPAVAAIVSGTKVWLRTDVVAFASGRRVPAREHLFMADMVIDVAGMAARFGVTAVAIRQRVHNEKWHLLPSPAGRAGGKPYWLTEQVLRWDTQQAA